MNKKDLPIADPCSENWDKMTGDDGSRFCGQCSKSVHNLSSMTQKEATTVLQTTPTPCVRYHCDQDGSIRFRSSRRKLLSRAVLSAGALMIALPAAASIALDTPPAPSLIERMVLTFTSMVSEAGTEMLLGEPVVMGGIKSPVEDTGDHNSIEDEVLETQPTPYRMGRPILQPQAPETEE